MPRTRSNLPCLRRISCCLLVVLAAWTATARTGVCSTAEYEEYLASRPTADILPRIDARPTTLSALRLVDRIVAWVNDEPITLSEVEEALVRLQGNGSLPRGPINERNLRRALEMLVDETLLEAAAVKMGVAVPVETVDNRVEVLLARIEERQGGRERLEAFLADAGETRERLRERLRGQVRRDWTIGQAVGSRFTISESDVEEFRRERRAAGLPAERYRLSHAFLPVPAGAAAAQWDRAESEVHALRIEAERRGDFSRTVADWAKRHAAEGALGGDLGTVEADEIQEELARLLPGLEEGASSEPVRTARGVHLLFLDQKTTAKQILFARRFEEERIRWAEELRRAAAIQISERLVD